jgi:RNA polymerase sigma-70 factor (ECF subfamily)
MTSSQEIGCEGPHPRETITHDAVASSIANSNTESDRRLVEQLRRRDPAAMNALIDRYGQRLHRTIGRLMAWSHDADDVLQDVLLRAWQRIDTYREAGRFEDWLNSLAFHRTRDHQRSLRRKLNHWMHYALQSQPDGVDAPPKQTSPSIDQDERWHSVQHAMHQLSASDRELLVMIHLEHWTHEQLAHHLNIPVDRLHVRLHRARQRLKSILHPS